MTNVRAERQPTLPALAEDLQDRLSDLLGSPVEVTSTALLAGGASKEAWAVDVTTADGALALLVRRAMGGAVFDDTLSLDHEYRVLQAAYAAGVRVPQPYGYLEDLGGREALVMARIQGESIGRRIVRTPELARARAALPRQMAEQLARIHSVAVDDVAFVPGPRAEPADPVLRGRLGATARPAPAAPSGDRARSSLAARACAAAPRHRAHPRGFPPGELHGRRAGPRERPRLGERARRRSR